MKHYKLRDKRSGKYSSGGYYDYKYWSTEGKTWSNLKNLKSHLRMKYGSDGEGIPDYLEVVEGEFIPAGTSVMLAKDLFNV